MSTFWAVIIAILVVVYLAGVYVVWHLNTEVSGYGTTSDRLMWTLLWPVFLVLRALAVLGWLR